MMLRGHQLKVKLAQLSVQHGITPVVRPSIPLVAPTDTAQVLEGICSNSDLDSDRMSFARGSLSWPALDKVPLLLRHDPNRVVGRVLDLDYDDADKLHIKARVDDLEAARMGGFSVAATVFEAEIVNEDSFAFYALVHRATVDEISLTPAPANHNAIVISRRDVTPMDITYDAALAAAARARVALKKLQAALSAPPSPPASLTLGASAPKIYGRVPAAVLQPRRNEFRDLVARLPTGN